MTPCVSVFMSVLRKQLKMCSHDNLHPALETWSVWEYPNVCEREETDTWCGWSNLKRRTENTRHKYKACICNNNLFPPWTWRKLSTAQPFFEEPQEGTFSSFSHVNGKCTAAFRFRKACLQNNTFALPACHVFTVCFSCINQEVCITYQTSLQCYFILVWTKT